MYSEFQPCHLLVPYVDKYWEFKGNPEYGAPIHILPDGCTDFIFTLGDVAQPVGDCQLLQPYHSFFVGPMNKYSELIVRSNTVHMLGIRFQPGSIFRFMNIPLHELTNQRINSCNLPFLFENSFIEILSKQRELRIRINLIEELLIKALYNRDLTDHQISLAIHQINLNHGKLPIHSLIDKVCLCQRQLERKFKLFTGYTPKEYSRIVKFRHAIERLTHANADTLFSIAVDSGYYDSAHLTREIKTLSGKPVSSFLAPDIPKDITLTYL